MAWTAASFKAARPEFGKTPDAEVTLALNNAAAYCSESAFGDQYDNAISLYAAHLLSIAPGGQHSRVSSIFGKTTYIVQWEELARIYGGGPRLVGA
jgi:hypothetical protein